MNSVLQNILRRNSLLWTLTLKAYTVNRVESNLNIYPMFFINPLCLLRWLKFTSIYSHCVSDHFPFLSDFYIADLKALE